MQNLLAKINLKNIRENALAFKRRTNGKLCAVVKADAYGHGAEETVFALSEIADFFAVATETEGVKIQTAACGKEILVLTPPVCEKETEGLLLSGLSITVASETDAVRLVRLAERLKLIPRVHLKLNTGMNRYGMTETELEKTCRFLKGTGVCVAGIYSHLYGRQPQTAEWQRLAFGRGAEICRSEFPNVTRHLAATYGAALGQDFYFDAVRIGLGLYGYLPSGVNGSVKDELDLKKAMTVYARVQSRREYRFGGAGYGELSDCERSALKGTGVSVLRAGYADGFFREKQKRSVSLLQTNDLCMDACLIAGRLEQGEYVPVLTDADESARRAGTTAYEILCGCTRRAELEYEYE